MRTATNVVRVNVGDEPGATLCANIRCSTAGGSPGPA